MVASASSTSHVMHRPDVIVSSLFLPEKNPRMLLIVSDLGVGITIGVSTSVCGYDVASSSQYRLFCCGNTVMALRGDTNILSPRVVVVQTIVS